MARKRARRRKATKSNAAAGSSSSGDERVPGENRPHNSTSTTNASTGGRGGGGAIDAQHSNERPSEAAEEARRNGNKEYHRKHYAEAVAFYSQGVVLAAHSPEFLVALFSNRAAAYIGMLDYPKCIADCTAALTLDPRSVKGYSRRAYAHFCLGEYEAAERDYARAAELEPTAQILDNLQRTRQELETRAARAAAAGGGGGGGGINAPANTENAHEHEEQSPYSEPSSLRPVQMLWTEWFDESAVPPSAQARAQNEKQQGNEAFLRGDLSAALRHYSAAIALFPSEAIFYSNRAQVHLKLESYFDVIHDCSLSIDLRATTKAHLRRATAWAAVGEIESALEDYVAALDKEPKHHECRVGLASVVAKLEARGPLSKALRAIVQKHL